MCNIEWLEGVGAGGGGSGTVALMELIDITALLRDRFGGLCGQKN